MYGEVNNEWEKDININDCNDCFDDRSYLHFRTIISANRTGSNFPDKSCNLFYRNIAWMEKRNGVLCDLFIDHMQNHLDQSGLTLKLQQLDIPHTKLTELATDAMLQTRLLQNNPRPLQQQDALQIYNAIYA